MLGDLRVLSSQCLAMLVSLTSRKLLHISRNSKGISEEDIGRREGETKEVNTIG
jgi:hypothetical protein